jgi:hypothetical protein
LVAGQQTELDPVRGRIVQLAREQGKSLRKLSLAIGQNHTYLQQFVKLRVPKNLPEAVRRALGQQLGVDADSFQPPEERESLEVRLPGEPLDTRLLGEADALARRLVPGETERAQQIRLQLLGTLYALLERQDAGWPIHLRDGPTLRILELLCQRLRSPGG